MSGDKVTTDIDVAKKKVKKAPQLVKANARQNVNQGKATKISKLTKQVQNSGSTDDVAALLLARRN
jgi:hypothetical protein